MKNTDFYMDRIDIRTGRTVSTDYFPKRVKCDCCPAKNKNVLLVRVSGIRRYLCAECRRVLDMLANRDSHSEMAA
jgi:hypothetical protein